MGDERGVVPTFFVLLRALLGDCLSRCAATLGRQAGLEEQVRWRG